MLEPLLPKDLTEKDAAFKTVEELHEVIDKALDKGEIKTLLLPDLLGQVRVLFFRHCVRDIRSLNTFLFLWQLYVRRRRKVMGRKRFRRVFKKTLGSQKVMKVNLQMGIVAINLRSKLKN